MTPTGKALKMTTEVRCLMVRHGRIAEPLAIPLLAPVDKPMIFNGYASTTDIDKDRCRFRPWAFQNPCLLIKGLPTPPLWFKHRPDQVAGKITSLTYDDRGNVVIEARVDHPEAKRCSAFSIGARIIEYEMMDQDDRELFHSRVNVAEITEVSVTDAPANPQARVVYRYPEIEDLMIKKIGVLQKIVAHLGEINARPRPEVRATPFAMLVQQINQREARP